MPSAKRIVVVGFDDAQSLDFSGPIEVFATADRLRPGRYSVELRTGDGQPFTTNSGLRIEPHGALAGMRGSIDTLIVAGGLGTEAARGDVRLIAAIRSAARRARRTASVCTGAFLLAEAGLLEGRRATTHWASTDYLGRCYPSVLLEPDRIFVNDGDIWTSAGVTSGMDLALAMLEKDYGRDAALEVARWLVLYAHRSGGQGQFSEPLAAQLATREPICEAQERVLEDPSGSHTVEQLADSVGLSVRSFARAFKREVGVTPAAYVESVRVERARTMLETTAADTGTVARMCGFGTVETFRRAFRRRVGSSPGVYRDRFKTAA